MLSRLASALLVVLVVGAVMAPPALARRSTPARSDARGIAANVDLIGLDIIPIDGLPSVEAQSPPTRPAVDAATLLSVPLTPLADVGAVELDATADADTGTATAPLIHIAYTDATNSAFGAQYIPTLSPISTSRKTFDRASVCEKLNSFAYVTAFKGPLE